MVKYRTKLHWVAILGPVLMTVIFGAGAIALLVLFMVRREQPGAAWFVIGALACTAVAVIAYVSGSIRRSSTEMAVTNRRVLMKSGLMGRKTTELMLSKVESIGVDQGFMGRMAGYGTVVVRGTGGTHETFDRVSRPLEFRRKVQEQIDQLQIPHA